MLSLLHLHRHGDGVPREEPIHRELWEMVGGKDKTRLEPRSEFGRTGEGAGSRGQLDCAAIDNTEFCCVSGLDFHVGGLGHFPVVG